MQEIKFPPSNVHQPLKEAYLKQLWKFVPGIGSEHSRASAPDNVKQKYFDAFVEICNDQNVKRRFASAKKLCGWPWTVQHDTDKGKHWAVTFARASYAIHFGISSADTWPDKEQLWEKVEQSVWSEVFMEDEEWKNEMKRLFRQARAMDKQYEDSLKNETGSDVGGVAELPEEKAKRANIKAQETYKSQGFF
jgi:hypothetical protein